MNVENEQFRAISSNDQTYAEISGYVDDWLSGLDGETFRTRDLWGEYNINSQLAKDYLRKLLKSRCELGVLRRDGVNYRKVDVGIRKLNWQGVSHESHFDLAWPLGLERWMKFYPHSTVVLAGSQGAGKTAFVYDFVMKNYHKHKINIWSNDMDEEEIAERFSMFGKHIPSPPPWDMFERRDKFEDVIVPDQINIVDFLKVYNNFWEIGDTIDAIDAQIGKGMVIICVQKNKGQEFGRGGSFGNETPKAYLSIDFQRLRVMKARGRTKPDIDPRGLQIDFKLHRGARFEELGYGWPE